ncbi:extracellular solute-binding protein [Dactylosporangium sp. AC04546]|uniref:extracellular solute-binding protein n=1 Tax=Dactylosporangium sp. AC04546 TaxID=2862460 RepID=UPI001EDD674F|nr:extracellular solute-binding protein [Dactylosporangium sp. AC04546]WVK86998.1 extracellular solute-binding protein [Dactylosporangium sp. AC04546]
MHTVFTRRRMLATALLATAAVPLSACGGEDEPSSPSSGDALSGTINFWHGYSSDAKEIKALRDVIIPGFQAKHPGTTVKDVAVKDSDLRQKVLTAATGGQGPDVLRADIAWVSEMAKLGLLERLDKAMPDFKTYADKVFPGALATNRYRDGYYGLPLDTNTRVLMYNADTLAKAGVTKPPATFEEMTALGDKLAGANVQAFYEGGLGGWQILPWIWSAGGDITDADYTKATGHLNSPQSLAGVQLLFDLYGKKQVANNITGATGGVDGSAGLPTGKYATILDGPWMYPIFASQYPDFKVQVAQVPAGPGGSISVVGGEDVVVFKGSKNKALAMEFSRYLLSDEAQTAFAKAGQMSVLKDLDQATINPTFGPFAQQLKTARPRPPVPSWSKINDLLEKKLQAAFKGDTSVQQALDAAAAEIDTLLAKD